MEVKIKYLGRTMELFGLTPGQKEETIYLSDKAFYKDAIEKLKEKFLSTNKSQDIGKYDIFNDVIIFSKGRILKAIEEKQIDIPEIVVAPLHAGG